MNEDTVLTAYDPPSPFTHETYARYCALYEHTESTAERYLIAHAVCTALAQMFPRSHVDVQAHYDRVLYCAWKDVQGVWRRRLTEMYERYTRENGLT